MRTNLMILSRRNDRRLRARLMRREGEAAGANANPMGGGAAPQNNTPGNFNPASQGQGQGNNNSGQGFDPASFWNQPATQSPSAPFQGSAANGDSPAPAQTQPQTQPSAQPTPPGQELAQQLRTRMSSLQFAPLFTADIAAQLGEGNLDGANQAMAQIGNQAVTQAVETSLMVMQQFGTHIMQTMEAKVQQMLEATLGQRDNNATLEADFPQLVSNPAMRPQVEAVFKQALTHTKNDRRAAVEMTRSMLQFMSQQMQSSGFGNLGDAPSDPMNSGAQNLIDSLLAR